MARGHGSGEAICFVCRSPASNKCQYCLDTNNEVVYYCCESHFQLHRSINNDGQTQCNPFIIEYSDSVGRYVITSS